MNEKHQGAIAKWQELIAACEASMSEEEPLCIADWPDGGFVDLVIEFAVADGVVSFDTYLMEEGRTALEEPKL
jgi:hypothetical protein